MTKRKRPKEKRRSRGRPKSENPREIVWPMRFTKTEAELIGRKAEKNGQLRGQWMRERILEAVT
jgi:hypothetical protein